MKMIWSWWPSVGFEPRYGGDIAFGQFSIAGYMEYDERIDATRTLLQEISQTASSIQVLPSNLTLSIAEDQELLNQAAQNYNDGWFSIASAKLEQASNLAQSLTVTLDPFTEASNLTRLQQELRFSLVAVSALLIVTNFYWYSRLKKSTRRRIVRHRRRKTKTTG